MVVAASVPLQSAAGWLTKWRPAEPKEQQVQGHQPSLCILGVFVTTRTTATMTATTSGASKHMERHAGGVWLVMEPGPRVRALHVCDAAPPSSSSPSSSPSAAVPKAMILLYRRLLQPCPLQQSTSLLPEDSTEMGTCIRLMARASSLEQPPCPQSPAARPTGEGPPPPASPLMMRVSLACVQQRVRAATVWRVLCHLTQPSAVAPAVTALLADSVLGLVLGLLLWRYGDALAAALTWLLHPEAVERGVAWLASNPGGVKVNGPLTQQLGAVIVLVARLYTAALQQAAAAFAPLPIPTAPTPPVVAAVGMGLGATTLLGGCFDLVRVLSGHVPLIQAGIACLYRLELRTLGALWRLFRGRKRNVLRRRVDTCEYSTPQLLLGTLLFTIGVALFPTLAGFHAFATALHLAVCALQTALWLLVVLLRGPPLHALALRLVSPDRFLDSTHVARCWPYKDDGKAMVRGSLTGKAANAGVVVRGAGHTITDTEVKETHQQDESVVGGVGQQGRLLRVEHRRRPWADLFDGYARTARALGAVAPSPGRALGALLLGSSLLVEGDGDGDESGEGDGRGPQRLPWSPRMASLPQMLVEAALVSSGVE